MRYRELVNELKLDGRVIAVTRASSQNEKPGDAGENLLALSVAGSDFEKMLSVTSECYFHSPVFKKIRAGIHKDEASEEKRFSILA